MTRKTPAYGAGLLFLLLAAAGCGKNVAAPAPGGIDQGTADDVAIQAVTNLGIIANEVVVLTGSTPNAPAQSARAANAFGTRNPARAAWDTTFTYTGVTYEASRTFYDALDNALPGYSALAVRMLWTSRAYGTYEGPRDTASVGHTAILDVRGIDALQDTLRFDGSCADSLLCTFRSYDGLRTRWFFWTGAAAIDGVRILKSTPGAPPHAGTITFAVSADRLRSNNRVDVEAHFDALVIVTFDGSTGVDVLVDGRFAYRWNLITGAITRV